MVFGQKTAYMRILDAALVGNGIGAELPWLRAILARIPAKPLQEAFKSSTTSYATLQKPQIMRNVWARSPA